MNNAWKVREEALLKRANSPDTDRLDTDEDKIYNQLIATLGDVDTRYLSIPGTRCYVEVFDLLLAQARFVDPGSGQLQ